MHSNADFVDRTEWGDLNKINYYVPYRSRTRCTEFVKCINATLFNEHIKSKLEQVNFVSVFHDGSTDLAVTGKECV